MNEIPPKLLIPMEPFDWTEMVHFQYKCASSGHQILHFNTQNKPYANSEAAKRFVEQHLCHAKPLHTDSDVLKYASENQSFAGAILEMGVGSARTTNFIAALNPTATIYGFDSFDGLPEDWTRSDLKIEKGTFALKNNVPPPILSNVKLFKGLFKDSLPLFKQEILKDTPIAFLHIDCDLYTSTKDIFCALAENIVSGTVIVFDELYNYPGYEEHEWKAFQEFLLEHHVSADFIAFNTEHEQVAVKLTPHP